MLIPTSEQRLKAREKPNRTPCFFQSWLELLFLHWTYDPVELQSFLPKGLYIDTYKGEGYIGVIPFFMNNIKPAFFGKTIPGINFYELNVRTYVYDERGVPGVWFFSLDVSNWLAAKIGRIFFHLPYYYSGFNVKHNQSNEWIDYQCKRHERSKSASFIYKRGDLKGLANLETLEFFLLERYHFFSTNKQGELFQTSVHHAPYQIYEAEVISWSEQPLLWNGLKLENKNPVHQMIVKDVHVNIYGVRTHKLD